MGEIIAVVSGKGGVGKTTVSANIAAGLAKKGYNILIIDMDMGLRGLDIVLDAESMLSGDILDAVMSVKSPEDIYSYSRSVGGLENLHFIPAPLTRDFSWLTADKMKDFLQIIHESFDYIILDGPAGVDEGFEITALGADSAIIVVNPDTVSVRSADRAVSLLEDRGIRQRGVIVNRLNTRLIKIGVQMNLDECLDLLGIPLLGVIYEDESVQVCASKGELSVNADSSEACECLKNIVERIDGANVPLKEINHGGVGILSKIIGKFKKS